MAAILSGANLNFHTLRYVSERCEIGENREALLAVTMPEQPGSFLKFAYVLGNRAVTEFSYRYADDKRACVFVGVRTTNEQEKADIIADLTKNGFDVEDMSDDDIAKTHVRYLMGGRASNDNERLYTFNSQSKRCLIKILGNLAKSLEYFIISLSCPRCGLWKYPCWVPN